MINLLKKYFTRKCDIIKLSNRIKKEIYDFARYTIKNNDDYVLQFPISVTYTMRLKNHFYTQNQLDLALELSDMRNFGLSYNMQYYCAESESIDYDYDLANNYNINIKLIIERMDGLF